MLVHATNDASDRGCSHSPALTLVPAQGRRVSSWQSLDDALRARVERKAALREEFAGHKQLWLARVIGKSEQHVSRCLRANHSDEMSDAQVDAIRRAIAGGREAA